MAGPIERSTELLPQFLRGRKFDYGQAVEGMRQILWGFFKKLVIADNCAFMANTIFADQADATGSMMVLGAFLFTFQIYGDFSGYSEIAVGCGKLFNIRLTRNFNLPYFSRSIAEFWRRWHISLNRWFIEYLYIPLGGSRHGRWRTLFNIMVVFALCGLWHGAAWTFVVWGVYNGVLVCLCHVAGVHVPKNLTAPGQRLPSLADCGKMTITFVLVMAGLAIFRSDTLALAADLFARVFSPSLFTPVNYSALGIGNIQFVSTICFISFMMLMEWSTRNRDCVLDIVIAIHWRTLRWTAYSALILVLMVFAGTQEQFIYFQF